MKNNSSLTPLRTSCERCRTQKLRCVPLENTEAGAPCQRCVKAGLSESCVFNSRSKTGRGAGRSRKLSDNGTSNPPTPAIPGMSTFALQSASPPFSEMSMPDPLVALSSTDSSTMPGLNSTSQNSEIDHLSENTSYVWQPNMAMGTFPLDGSMDNSSDLFTGLDHSASSDIFSQLSDFTMEIGAQFPMTAVAHSDLQCLVPSPSDVAPPASSGAGMASEETQTPLAHFTALLTEMSSYDSRILRLAVSKLHDYPIGDAIFLSRRFHHILSDGRNSSTDPTSRLGTPTLLLAFSCFLTLLRIYSSIFDHIREYLSAMVREHSAQQWGNAAHTSLESDVRLYRGLRLGQLQPICLCSDWDPTKKAVSMLLSSLRSVEELLGLPLDLRVVDTSEVEEGDERTSTTNVGKLISVEDDTAALLSDGSLCRTVKEQAMQLGGKVREVNRLLKEPNNYCYPSPPGLG